MGVGSDALRLGSRVRGPDGTEDEVDPDSARPWPRSGSDSAWLILAIAGVIAFGVALRFIARSDLWADEVLSVNIARLPLSDLQEALRHDGAPPLYYALLHVWMEIFGTGNEAVRSLSGLFGIAALVPAWYAGRRLDERRISAGLQEPGTRTIAWAAVLLLAASPFAIRYATEARMYALVMLLVFLGYLALLRMFDRPSVLRLVCLGAVTGLLLYTHYWAFALLAVVGVWLIVVAVRGAPPQRRTAWWSLGALGLGTLTFVPWLPTFLHQAGHTGTPWGAVVSPVSSTAEAVKSFGGNTHVVGWALLLMVLLAVFARATDGRYIELDLWTRPGVRMEVVLGFVTLGLGLLLARATSTTFEGRYASVMFPLFLLGAAFGVTVFANRAARYAVIALLLVGGFWGGTSNALRSRTQAFQVANAIRHGGHAGDLVVYCPDSIGTDVSRLLPDGVRQVGLPGFTAPGRIDWVDYSDRVDAMRPLDAVRDISRRAGSHTIWFVYSTGTQSVDTKCGLIADGLAVIRPRLRTVEPDPYFFEHQGVYEYPPAPRG
ncbi:MAG: glycosyltransferase family 39 protein [Acidimicrobiia bacterium]